MSSHFTNVIIFNCEQNRLLEILSAIQYDDNGKNSQFGIGTIDFNKIVPIPEPLIVDDEVCPYNALCLYLTSINPDVDYFDGTKLSQEEFQAMISELSLERSYIYDLPPYMIEDFINEESKPVDELLSIGKLLLENRRKYGFASAGEWCSEESNWNTVLNAYGCAYDGENKLFFQTTGDVPFPVIKKLAQMFPDVEITQEYFGGYFEACCGRGYFKNGEFVGGAGYMYELREVEVPSNAEDKMQKYCVLFAPALYDINPDDPDAITAKALELATNDTFDYKCLCYPVLDASCFNDDINDEASLDSQNNDDLCDLFD
ncbi:MAG: hypothetical protein IKU81_07075 [Oscillibacter sp.]|nr:hypothetical protein [Oscillibacter sp.]